MLPPSAPVNIIPQPIVPNALPTIVPPPPVVSRTGVLPEGLRALERHHQFIVYRRADKVPFSYKTGAVANPHDADSWTDWATAASVAAAWGAGFGNGFVLTAAARIAVIDIDNCHDSLTGKLSDWASILISMLPGAYVEVSISGTGVHIWFSYSGEMPAHGNKVAGVGEFYHGDRYFALGTPYVAEGFVQGSVETDLTGALLSLQLLFPPNAATTDDGDAQWTSVPCTESYGVPADDGELLSLALRSTRPITAESAFGVANQRTSVSFEDLWTGNEKVLSQAWPASGRKDGLSYDASGVDNAVASELAYFTGCNCERIERLMLSNNALRRDRWDEPRRDYGTWLRMTITKAVRRKNRVYGDTRATSALGATAGVLSAPGAPGDAITIGSIDLKGIEASLLQQKTQDSVALVFELKQAGKLLYNHSRGQWMEWDGTRWKYEATLKAFDFTRNLARALNFGGASSSMGSASFCGGVEKFSQASRTFAVEGNQFDRDNYLLNTPSGTIDLRTGQMRPHEQADMITKCTLAAPDAVSDGATFQKFMLEITEGDEELIQFHQVSLGAILSGAVEDHWMLFWTGEGRNGKNTLGELVEEAIGDYARKIASSVLMAKPNEGHLAELAQLQGVRIAISSEINDGDHWHESRIKELTGDATINARFMRQDHFTFQRTQKHLIYGNHRPQLRSVDSAIRSRIKIVPFKASFLGREDKDLPRRLREEIGYVLQWLIDGHIKWLEAGKKLPPCAAVDAESADYFASQSTPEMWLSERCEILTADDRPALHLPGSGDLYRDYSDWKKARGEQPISQTRWAQGVMRGFEKVKTNQGLRYRGLRLLPHVLSLSVAPFPVQEAKSSTGVVASPTRSEAFEQFVERELERLAKL
jgi:putative DNA primase/helicase